MADEVIVTVNTDAGVTVTVNGVTGKRCKEITAQLEKALGKTTKSKLTADYYKQKQQRLKIGGR